MWKSGKKNSGTRKGRCLPACVLFFPALLFPLAQCPVSSVQCPGHSKGGQTRTRIAPRPGHYSTPIEARRHDGPNPYPHPKPKPKPTPIPLLGQQLLCLPCPCIFFLYTFFSWHTFLFYSLPWRRSDACLDLYWRPNPGFISMSELPCCKLCWKRKEKKI